MTAIQTIAAIWSFIAACAVLFIRGSTMPPTRGEARRMGEFQSEEV